MTRIIAVLITCFNRKEKTLACLSHLAGQQLPKEHRLQVYLVDDGCTDGTGEAVKREFPDTIVIQGTGSLYWAGGMRLAWSEAAKDSPDYFLLINDDTEVVPHAISSLLNLTGEPANRKIAVAAIADPATNRVIYGAYRNGITGNLPETDSKEHCNTFNANCVLVCSSVYKEIGMLDAAYTHGMADHDYGYLASKAKINIVQSTETLGTCVPNSKEGTWQDSTLSRRRRWQLVSRPNGLLWRDWLTYCHRHLGLKWPLYFVSPYLRILLKK